MILFFVKTEPNRVADVTITHRDGLTRISSSPSAAGTWIPLPYVGQYQVEMDEGILGYAVSCRGVQRLGEGATTTTITVSKQDIECMGSLYYVVAIRPPSPSPGVPIPSLPLR